MGDDELFFVRDRQLEYPVFDVDNHMYENTDSFTKYIPKEYDGLVDVHNQEAYELCRRLNQEESIIAGPSCTCVTRGRSLCLSNARRSNRGIRTRVAPSRRAFCMCTFRPGTYRWVAAASKAQYTSSFTHGSSTPVRQGTAENSV